MVDEIAWFNRERWEDLARAGIQYSRPFLDLDEETARSLIDPEGLIGHVRGRDVLCLAGGGGQQSAAFGLLGANVTVVDLSATQLERDREAARHYGHQVRAIQGDMRDLSMLSGERFDVVWHAHSINFVPDARQVFGQVRSVIRNSGIYHLACQNPFAHSIEPEEWTGDSYPLRGKYGDGEIHYPDPHWDFTDADGVEQRVVGPREFRHTLETLINGLTEHGFGLVVVREITDYDPGSEMEPGSWAHLQSIMPPYLGFWTVYRPTHHTGSSSP